MESSEQVINTEGVKMYSVVNVSVKDSKTEAWHRHGSSWSMSRVMDGPSAIPLNHT